MHGIDNALNLIEHAEILKKNHSENKHPCCCYGCMLHITLNGIPCIRMWDILKFWPSFVVADAIITELLAKNIHSIV